MITGSLTLVVEVDELVSVNQYLLPGMAKGKGGKPYPYLFKAPKVVAYQKEVQKQLEEQLHHVKLPKQKLSVAMFFQIRNDSDTSNMIKLFEDALKDAIGVDDINNRTLLSSKDIIPGLTKERALVVVSYG